MSDKIFRAYLIKFPTILFSEVEFFTFYSPGLAIFRGKKETYNFQIQKSDGERN